MEASSQFAIVVAVALGVTKAINMAGVSTRWSALIAIGLGVLSVGVLVDFSGGSVIGGVIAGLTAAGLWSGTKAILA